MTNQTFEQLKKTYESGRTRPLAWRRAQLNALRRLVTENRDAFVSSAMADLGKPAAETVLMELNLVAGEAQFVRNRLSLWTARHPKAMHWMLQPAAGWTIAEPKGVVLIISPWNYPVLLALEPMADALAAGNAVCLKPSELSPNTSKLLAELVPQYLDSEAVRVVEGGPKETGELLKCPFNHIFYTGGGHVGKIVMRAAAEHLTPVTLELGGKSPCFVDRTADINVAARRIAWGKFTNAGQTCVAPDYVLATSDVAEALVKRIAVAVTEFYGEDPKASPDFGRIINDRHFERLCKLLPVGTVPPEEPSSPLVQVASAVGAAMDMVGRRLMPCPPDVQVRRTRPAVVLAVRTMRRNLLPVRMRQPLIVMRLPRPLLSRARFTRCPACSTRPVESFAAARSIVPPGISRLPCYTARHRMRR